MESKIINIGEKKLVGFSMRTNNATELNPETNKIGPFVQQYFANQLAKKIPFRTKPGVTYAGYYNYATDEYGDYRFFLGEEVSEISHAYPDNMNALIIPAGKFFCLTTDVGPIAQVEVEGWKKIWNMTSEEMGGKRHYLVDFVVYDERAANRNNAEVDIYIGLVG